MRLEPGLRARLQLLSRVVQKESHYLRDTDARLFAQLRLPQSLESLEQDALLAERLEAFVGWFGRLQDTQADKFLPALLEAMAEPRGAAVENLDRAEKPGWIASTDQWLAMRKLRNQMVHEYIEDLTILGDALEAGHAFVPTLADTALRLIDKARQRLASS